MTIKKMVGAFAWTYRLPIEIADVIAELRKIGVEDEINFYKDPDLPKEIIQGYLTRWFDETKNAFVSNITYADLGDPYRERLVCVKELMHIVDVQAVRVRSDAELKDQVKKIVLPLHLQEILNLSPQIISDIATEAYAMAVMTPFNARNAILSKYKAGTLTLDAIADKARMPITNVQTVMSDRWLDVYKRMLPGELREVE